MKSLKVGIGITVLVVLMIVIVLFLVLSGRLGCHTCDSCNNKSFKLIEAYKNSNTLSPIDTLRLRNNKYVLQDKSPGKPKGKPKVIHVLSYNVFLRPHLVQNDAQCSRASLIPFSILDHFTTLQAPTPDIICCQECFSERATKYLVTAFRRAGWPFIAYPNPSKANGGKVGSKVAVVGSGLLIASKFPYIDLGVGLGGEVSISFAACEGTDCLAAKGFMHVLIDHPDLGRVHVINTHLQLSDAILPPNAPQSGKKWSRLYHRRQIQLQQLQHIYDYVSTSSSIKKTDVVIYSGDWNIDLLRSNNYNNQFGLVMSALHTIQP